MATVLDLAVTKVSDSVNIADNTSKVKITLKIDTTDSSGTHNLSGDTSGYITIDGTKVASLDGKPVNLNAVTTLYGPKEHKIKHNDDGKKTITVKAAFDVNTSVRWIYATKTLELPTIARETTLDSLSCATSYLDGKMTYKYTPKSSALYNQCVVSLNVNGTHHPVRTISLGKKTAAQQTATVTLTAEELKAIYEKLPSTNKGVMRFTFTTYSDSGYSQKVGNAVNKELTLYVPSNSDTWPILGMLGLKPVGLQGDAFAGLYVQGKTKVRATTLDAIPQHNAKIESYSMEVQGVIYDSDDNYTSGYLTQTGSVKVYGYAKDSRGITGFMQQTITVIPYANPKILNVTAKRCDKNGGEDESGTYLKISATRSYSKVVSSEGQENFCEIRYRWKSESGSYGNWTTILPRNASDDTVTTEALLNGGLSKTSAYTVQVQAIDDIGEYSDAFISIPTETVYMHRIKNGMGLGTYCNEGNLLDVSWNARFRGEVKIGEKTLLDLIHPVGSLYWSSDPTDPATLFGGTWKRIKDRFILAAGDAYNAEATGGAATVKLTASQLPKLSGTVNFRAWSTGSPYLGATGIFSSNGEIAQEENTFGISTSSDGLRQLKIAFGGDAAHENMPPYAVKYCWERTA